MKRFLLSAILLIGLTALVIGCNNQPNESDLTSPSDSNNNTTADPDFELSTDPATLNIYSMPAFNEQQVQDRIVKPVQNKYPHLSFNVMPTGTNQYQEFERMMTSGVLPDIMMTNYRTVSIIKDLQLSQDISELAKQQNSDLNRFMPTAIDSLKLFSDQDELLGLPYFLNMQMLVYNKEIFDNFAVDYPADGMTWNEIMALVRNLTKISDGVQYYGMNPARPQDAASQLSLSFIDLEAKKADVNNEGWQRVFNLYKEIYSVPGNQPPLGPLFWNVDQGVFQDRVVAMGISWWNGILRSVQQVYEGDVPMDWDITTVPAFDDARGKGFWLDQFVLSVAGTSKHKEAAFAAIDYLTSKENQLNLSAEGYATVLNDQEVNQHIGSAIPALEGKNLQSIFLPNYTEPMFQPEFNIMKIMNDGYKKAVYDGVDTNTVLRELEEIINNEIEQSNL